jgi:hypothetical protein
MPGIVKLEQPAVTRREFTVEAALAILSTCVITVSDACSSNKNPTTPPTQVADVNGTVSANHGHIAVVAAAQITTGSAISLDIRGQATHPHTVSITAADLTSLKNRSTVTATSSTDNGHNHVVTFTPA